MEPAPPSPPRSAWREHWTVLREDIAAPRPVPRGQGALALVRYGLAQPFLGLRTIMRSSDLLGISLAPALGVLLIAGLAAYSKGSEEGALHGLGTFLVVVAALAPVPSLLFGRVYAHLAAKARGHLGLSPTEPYLRSVPQLIGEWLAQVVVLAIGVAPFVALARIMPSFGPGLALLLQGLWALHWIVVEGYDNARTVPQGRTIAEMEEESRARPGSPWFHRPYERIVSPRWLFGVLAPLRMLSEIVVSLARPWRVEVDLTENEPWISLGFGLGAAAMLAVPGLNLLFRPAVVVAGVHLRHRLLDEDVPQAGVSRSGTQPYSVVPPGARGGGGHGR